MLLPWLGAETLGHPAVRAADPSDELLGAMCMGDVFADYLADVDLTSEVQGEAYSSLVDAFCYWIVETESAAQRQALACQLTDPEFTCVSEAVQEDLPAIAARIAE